MLLTQSGGAFVVGDNGQGGVYASRFESNSAKVRHTFFCGTNGALRSCLFPHRPLVALS